MGPTWRIRPDPDWWARAGILIAGLALLCTVLSGTFAGAIWVIDHRIADQLAPLKADLVLLKQHFGIQQPYVGSR